MLRLGQSVAREGAQGAGDHRTQRQGAGGADRGHPRRVAHHHRQAYVLETQPIDVGTIARAAVEAVRPTAEAKGIQLETSISMLPAGFRGDPSRLQQVIWNLLSNAIKFTPAGGHVALSVDELAVSPGGQRGYPGDARIVVRDNGRGIDPSFVPFIFDRFRQVDSTSKRAYGGLGLGLAIVRHLVELHGGAIGVESAGEGRGAAFTVTLPRAEKSNGEPVGDAEPIAAIAARLRSTVSMPGSAAPGSADATDGISLQGVRVLLVDDEPDARELLAEVLEQYGAEVSAVASANEAVRVLREERPTVLLSDIGLPGEDGHSLMRRVRALPPEAGGRTPAAALTAFARTEDGRRSLAAGFHRHATKPIQPAALASLVRELADLAAASTPNAR